MRVEVVSDVVCPWCYIGKRRFERAVAQLRADGVTTDIEVHYRAYQLDPTAPLDNPVPVRSAYAKKFGGEARADAILSQVTHVAAQEGIEFQMDQAIRANTLPAHRLLKLVAHHAPHLQADVNESVMRAYFCEGKDISDIATLVSCAQRAQFAPTHLVEQLTDLDPQSVAASAVTADLLWASEHDVTAVPTFIINDSFAVPGAQDSETFARLLKRVAQQ